MKEYNYCGTHIGNTGCSKLYDDLKKKMAKAFALDLQDNAIGEEGCKSIAKLINENSCLKKIDLSGNLLEDAGCKLLCTELKNNKSLEVLMLDDNHITDDSINELADLLKSNSTLLTLELNDNIITNKGVKALKDAIQYNKSLRSLALENNETDQNSGEEERFTALKKEIETQLLSGKALNIDPQLAQQLQENEFGVRQEEQSLSSLSFTASQPPRHINPHSPPPTSKLPVQPASRQEESMQETEYDSDKILKLLRIFVDSHPELNLELEEHPFLPLVRGENEQQIQNFSDAVKRIIKKNKTTLLFINTSREMIGPERQNCLGTHWIGMVVRKSATDVVIELIDSANTDESYDDWLKEYSHDDSRITNIQLVADRLKESRIYNFPCVKLRILQTVQQQGDANCGVWLVDNLMQRSSNPPSILQVYSQDLLKKLLQDHQAMINSSNERHGSVKSSFLNHAKNSLNIRQKKFFGNALEENSEESEELGIFERYLNVVRFNFNRVEKPHAGDSVSSVCTDIIDWMKQKRDYQLYFVLLIRLRMQLEHVKKISLDDSKTLVNNLLDSMADVENAIYEQDCMDDPGGVGKFVNRDELESVVGNLILLCIPKIDILILAKMFEKFLGFLRRKKGAFHLPRWVYQHGVMLSIEHLDEKYKERLFDFYLQSFNDKICTDSYGLRSIVITVASEERRHSILKRLIDCLGAYSHNRTHQKNFGALFVDIFNKLEEMERKKIYSAIIAPMFNHESLHLRQSLAEILAKITIDPQSKVKLLKQLLNDKESEVRRFAENAIEELRRSKVAATTKGFPSVETALKSESESESESDSSLSRFIVTLNESIRNLGIDVSDSILASDNHGVRESQKREFENFKCSLLSKKKEKLIAGLNNHNYDIQKYCLNNLPSCYMGFFCNDKDKKNLVNILFDAYQKPNFVLSESKLIDYIHKNLTSKNILNEPLIKRILSLLRENKVSDNIEWLQLIWLLSTESSEVIRSQILDSCAFILESSKHKTDFKQNIFAYLFNYVYGASSNCLSHAMAILVKHSNSEDEQIREGASAAIEEYFSFVDEDVISQLAQTFIESLTNVNPNYHDQKIIDKILGFLVYVIAQLGNCPRSESAVTVLITVIERSKDSALAVFTKQLLYDYGVVNLLVLRDLRNCIREKIKSSKAWSAYDKMHFLGQIEPMQKLLRSSAELQVHYQPNRIFLTVSYLIKKNRLDEANDQLKKAEEEWLFYPLYTFLEAEIKFKNKIFTDAIALYEHISGRYPHYIRAKLRIYQSYQALKKFSAVAKTREEIRSLSPQLELNSDASEQADQEEILPLAKTIAFAQEDVDAFIKKAMDLINTKSDETERIVTEIAQKFDALRTKLCDYFGSSIRKFFQGQAEIRWEEDLVKYPNQLPRFVKDIFLGILQLVLPEHPIKLYQPHQLNVEDMQKLETHITDSEISNFVGKNICDPSNFLKRNAEVFSAYQFIKEFAFSGKMKNACALGLSGDISQAYNLLVGLLQLKHWQLVYEEVSVEPSGSTEDTNSFMKKALEREEAVIMFVPRIINKKERDNPTLDEIKYLLREMEINSFKNKVYFVFGAYEFLPIYLQLLEPIHRKQRSLGRSFKPILDHVVKFFGIQIQNQKEVYRSLMEHMLYTRIKINWINNKTEDRQFAIDCTTELNKMFDGGVSFVDTVNNLLKKIPEVNEYSYIDSEWKVISCLIKIFDSLLFTDIPWFGSKYQFSDLEFAECLREKLSSKKSNLDRYGNCSGIVKILKGERENELSTFINYLDLLIGDLKNGLQWKGLSDFSSIASLEENTRHQSLPTSVSSSSSRRSHQQVAVEFSTYERIVFQGGSITGMAYFAELKKLYSTTGLHPNNIRRVTGISVGALNALLVGLNYSSEEIDYVIGTKRNYALAVNLPVVRIEALLDSNFGKLLFKLYHHGQQQSRAQAQQNQAYTSLYEMLIKIKRFYSGIKESYNTVYDINQRMLVLRKALDQLKTIQALCPGNQLLTMIQKLIAYKTGNSDVTFQELAATSCFKDIACVGVNLISGKQQIFSVTQTPNFFVADAIRISMSIPGLFAPHRPRYKSKGQRGWQTADPHVDGGLLYNYSVDIFDTHIPVPKQCPRRQAQASPQSNPNTLSFRLDSPEKKYQHGACLSNDEASFLTLPAAEDVCSLWQTIRNLLNDLNAMKKEESLHARGGGSFQTICVDATDVQLLD